MELYSLQIETCLLNTSVNYQSYETGAAENFFSLHIVEWQAIK